MLIKGLGTGNFKAFSFINYSVLTETPRPHGTSAPSAGLFEALAASPTGFTAHAELRPRSVSKPVSQGRRQTPPSLPPPGQTPHREQLAPRSGFLF